MLLGVLLSPATSAALDVDAALRGSAEWDSNVRRTDGPGQTDDFIFRITPLVSVLEDRGDFRWNINYRFPYEVAVNTTRVQGFRHFLNAGGVLHVTERTRIYARDQFSRSDALSRNGGTTDDDVVTIGSFRVPVWRNRATLGVTHSFTPRLQGEASFTHRYFDTDLLNRSRTNVLGGSGNVSYAVSRQHRLGGGVAGTYQAFDESNAGTRPASQAFFLNMFASWIWAIDETTSLSVSGGPTYIDTQQDAPPFAREVATIPSLGGAAFDFASCSSDGSESGRPVLSGCTGILLLADPDEVDNAGTQTVTFASGQNPGAIDDNTWNFFAQLSLSKRWSPVNSTELSYTRTDSTASGLGSSVLDAVGLSHRWRFAERWIARFRASFTRRESTAPQTQTLLEVTGRPTLCLNGTGAPAACTVASTLDSTVAGGTFLTSREVSNNIDTMRWGFGASVDYRITRHLSSGLRYKFNSQDSRRGSVGSFSDFGNHLVTLGVQYDFDRYSLDKYVPW